MFFPSFKLLEPHMITSLMLPNNIKHKRENNNHNICRNRKTVFDIFSAQKGERQIYNNSIPFFFTLQNLHICFNQVAIIWMHGGNTYQDCHKKSYSIQELPTIETKFIGHPKYLKKFQNVEFFNNWMIPKSLV